MFRVLFLVLMTSQIIACQNERASQPDPASAPTMVVGGLSVSTCATDAHCPTGLCLNLGTDKVCTTACGTDADCAPAWYCATEKTLAATHKYCAPGPRAPASLRPH